jgi:PhnB protein
MYLNPYLGFNGNCREAFQAYEKIFRGKILMMQTNGESPMADQMPPEVRDRVMHARLAVGDKLLMGGDNPGNDVKVTGFCVMFGTDTPEEADRIFGELSQGGTIEMPIAETFWASRFGMCTDRFGIPWMVNCDLPT